MYVSTASPEMSRLTILPSDDWRNRMPARQALPVIATMSSAAMIVYGVEGALLRRILKLAEAEDGQVNRPPPFSSVKVADPWFVHDQPVLRSDVGMGKIGP